MAEENRTLLILDDEPETLRGYEQFLQSVGGDAAVEPRRQSSRMASGAPAPSPAPPKETYRLLLAASGEAAVEAVRREMAAGGRVAAGFFDVKLGGGMDGLQAIQAIRALDKDIHCVVVTAYHDRTVEEIHRIFGDEFKDQWDYLNKPFTQGEIVQKARQMVSAWNRKRAIEGLTQQLIRSERLAAIGQVARGVGHEFGNILLRILGKADLALNENEIEKVRAHLQVVLTAAERAGVIVRNLQSFSKAEPQFQTVSPQVSFEQSLSLMSHELVKASVKLEKRFNSTAVCRMDPGAIAQVLLNLMLNAVHAMSAGGTLTVGINDVNGKGGREYIACSIADTGTGIPTEVLPRIFDFAFSTKGDRGSGLGLSISKELAEAHDGYIEVKTEVGKGSTFTLFLPKGSTP